MQRWITLSNIMDSTRTVRMEHRFAFNDCSCTTTIPDEACTAYNVQVEYAPLCKSLGFDPHKELFIAGTLQNIPIVAPVDPQRAMPFDNCVPVVRIPVHKCTGSGIALTQTGPLSKK